MNFQDIENSNDGGRPIFLYEFVLGPTHWLYNSSATEVIYDGHHWLGEPISDDGVYLTGESTVDTLTITASADIGPARSYIGTPPSSRVNVRVRHLHESGNSAAIVFVGHVAQVDFPRPGESQLKVESLTATMAREGLRLGWQRTCPHALYDPMSCKVDKSAWVVEDCVILESANGVVELNNISHFPSGYFDGGFLEWDHPIRGVEVRGIESHTGQSLRMFGFSDGLTYGMRVRAYPGCKRTPAACKAFGNYPNYGGVPHMPGKSPFDGDPIW